MRYEIKSFKKEDAEIAAKLFLNNYKKNRNDNSLLPSEILNNSDYIIENIISISNNYGLSIWKDQKMLGYMITGAYFNYKGQKASWIPEYAHSSLFENKSQLYQLMYMNLGQEWIMNKCHLHLICHFANDSKLNNVLFQLGFGAIVAEQIRNLSTTTSEKSNIIIKNESDFSKLLNIQIEHSDYYLNSPIFIKKKDTPESILDEFEINQKNGDQFLVHYENNEPLAYLIVGKVKEKSDEGFIIKNTNTAQIMSAYAKPGIRGKGIGKLLLNEAVKWAKENNFERLFVEHETANYYGGNFWNKHFTPMMYASMRYIDNTINILE